MNTFDELNLLKPVRKALAEQKYEAPTPIQARTIPPAIDGRDILGCAQTGTGKTAAFALPILNRLGKRNRKSAPNHPYALVLAPTRELAIQTHQSFRTYGSHLRLRTAVVYGGVSQTQQVRSLNRGAHILVATPGRLLDLMSQEHVKLNRLDVFVLDEADRMLDMGFLPDLTRIIRRLPERRQSLFFSATLPPPIVELTTQLLHDPINVNVTPESPSVEQIEQRVFFVSSKGKNSLLRHVLSTDDVERTLVFTRTKRRANDLSKQLIRSGVPATAIHGNKSQNARQKALQALRTGDVRVLVATDVAARGLDIDDITHVINFDMPTEPENYVHRIGRTGRAGAAGVAMSFCCSAERADLYAIEKLIGQQVPPAIEGSLIERSDTRNQPQNPRKPANTKPVGSERPIADSKVKRSGGNDRPKRRRRRRSRPQKPQGKI